MRRKWNSLYAIFHEIRCKAKGRAFFYFVNKFCQNHIRYLNELATKTCRIIHISWRCSHNTWEIRHNVNIFVSTVSKASNVIIGWSYEATHRVIQIVCLWLWHTRTQTDRHIKSLRWMTLLLMNCLINDALLHKAFWDRSISITDNELITVSNFALSFLPRYRLYRTPRSTT